jgi:hypothetical protein
VTAAYGHPGAPSPLSPLVDEQRLGSAGGQAAIGIAGIVLAIVLVMGQVSLAMTKGIAVHMHNSVIHITQGNKTMESVIERAAPSVAMESALASQSKTLANTRDAMKKTNAELLKIETTKERLLDVVSGMESSSSSLASNVAGVNASTTKMTGMLGTLPDATSRTHKQLSTINTDTTAINTELNAIAAKMVKYGLPTAKGAPTG